MEIYHLTYNKIILLKPIYPLNKNIFYQLNKSMAKEIVIFIYSIINVSYIKKYSFLLQNLLISIY
jgi:hypothetical protein